MFLREEQRRLSATASKLSFGLLISFFIYSYLQFLFAVIFTVKMYYYDEASSEASAFQREEVELAKAFLKWHVAKTSH